MNTNLNCSYMAMSSLTYILGISLRFFQPVYSVLEYYEIKITSKSLTNRTPSKASELLKTWIICGGGMKFHKTLDE
jgi:hypothetical protein